MMSQLKAAMNNHLRQANVMSFMSDFMKRATRAAKAEQDVKWSVEIYDKAVQRRKRPKITHGQPMLVDAGGASSSSDGVMAAPSGFSNDASSSGGCHEFVLVNKPDVELLGPNSGEDAAAIAQAIDDAKKRVEDAKKRVEEAFDLEAKAMRKNRDSFNQHDDTYRMRKAVSYEDRLVINEETKEVYPGRKRHNISLYGRIWYTPHTHQVLKTKMTLIVVWSVCCDNFD